VFTARYALSPYIKQIHFVFKGLIITKLTTAITYIYIYILQSCILRQHLVAEIGTKIREEFTDRILRAEDGGNTPVKNRHISSYPVTSAFM
jgi:hypothetical protein